MTLLSRSSSGQPIEPAGNTPGVVGWVEAGTTAVQPARQTLASDHPHAYVGAASTDRDLPGGQSTSVIMLLTAVVAVVFVLRLGLVLSRKIRPTLSRTNARQDAGGNCGATPTAAAVSTGRNG